MFVDREKPKDGDYAKHDPQDEGQTGLTTPGLLAHLNFCKAAVLCDPTRHHFRTSADHETPIVLLGGVKTGELQGSQPEERLHLEYRGERRLQVRLAIHWKHDDGGVVACGLAPSFIFVYRRELRR